MLFYQFLFSFEDIMFRSGHVKTIKFNYGYYALINIIIAMMSTDPKRRIQRELHGNQNYLNFIKKNHLSMYLSLHSARTSLMATPKQLLFPSNSTMATEVATFHSKERTDSDRMSKGRLIQVESSTILYLNYNMAPINRTITVRATPCKKTPFSMMLTKIDSTTISRGRITR